MTRTLTNETEHFPKSLVGGVQAHVKGNILNKFQGKNINFIWTNDTTNCFFRNKITFVSIEKKNKPIKGSL